MITWTAWKGLNRVTQVIAVATIARLIADTLIAVRDIRTMLGMELYSGHGDYSPAMVFATIAHAYAYSLLFLGSAATVELLFRIWGELRQLRLAGVQQATSPPSLDG